MYNPLKLLNRLILKRMEVMDEIYRIVAKMHRDGGAAGQRSFDSVGRKFAEADFILERLNNTRGTLVEAGFFFSAFLSAARSVTLVLQAVMKDVDGFKDWYEVHQRELKADPVARYFKNRRDMAVHPGEFAIFGIVPASASDKEGSRYLMWPSMENNSSSNEILEAGPTARIYMKSLAKLIITCYETFGSEIDPEIHYTKENLERLGLTIEDVEESLGYQRGWTLVDGSDDEIERRLQLLRRTMPNPQFRPILMKYL